MNHKLIVAASLGLMFTSSIASAADAKPEEKSAFESSAELGMLFKSGNTDSIDLKAGYDLKYEKDLWRSTLAFDLLVKKADQVQDDGSTDLETTDQKWTIVSKTNYILNKANKSYVYGDLSYEDSRTGSFDNQSSFSAGWGREWYRTDIASFFADIGPGYKRDVLKANSETQSSFIVQAQALYLRKINEHVEFKQTLSAKYSPDSGDNSTYNAESSITTKLIESMQLKVSFRVDHNTEVEAGTERTDTETAITLVYSF
jgi:putative salt-induced outer membrane protein YdiY